MPRQPIDPLGHPAREEIMLALKVIGELTPAELTDHLPDDCDRPTTAYHVGILERAELVERVGGVCRLTVQRGGGQLDQRPQEGAGEQDDQADD